jgi:hypothetical protein
VHGNFLEFHHALRIGRFVDAKNGRNVEFLEVRGDSFIRREHEFLDDAVRCISRSAADAGHLAPFVEFDERLGEIKIDGAAAAGTREQDRLELNYSLAAAK